MATLLKSTKSSVGSPYIYYAVSAEYSQRTETSVKVKVTVKSHLANSASYFLTGLGLKAKIKLGGEWRAITLKSQSAQWRGTTVHTASDTFTVKGLNALTAELTGIRFKVVRTDSNGSSGKLSERRCSDLAISSASGLFKNVSLSVLANSQKQVTATLEDIPTGGAKVICWYRSGTLIATDKITSSTKSRTFTGLKPNTRYAIKAQIRVGSASGALIATRDKYITTPTETGSITLSPGARYISATVSGMFLNPGYSRRLDFYIKRSTESVYTLKKQIEDVTKASSSGTFRGLVSGLSYDIKVNICNGNTALKTLSKSISTVADNSLIPMPFIDEIWQSLGTRLCSLTWSTDKSVAGTTYKVQAREEGSASWIDVDFFSGVLSPSVINISESLFPSDNPVVEVRIAAENQGLVSGQQNASIPYTIAILDEFEWDVPKLSGQGVNITANEWNRLGKVVTARNLRKGLIVDIPEVLPGEFISAGTYNIMKNAVSNLAETGIGDKMPADAIRASDIDALRIAVNSM